MGNCPDVFIFAKNKTTMEHFIEQVAPYYRRYISLVPDTDVLAVLKKSLTENQEFLSKITETESLYSYAPGKWTIRELIGHLTDAERVFAFRALCIARKEKQNLPGFEEDDYVKAGRFNHIKWTDLLQQFKSLRQSNIDLFASFDEEALQCEGMANNAPTNVRAILYIIAGHEIHHMQVLKERYLKK